MNILAGSTQDLRYDPEADAFVPAADLVDGPVFTIRAVDYFTALQAQGHTEQHELVRAGITAGLVSIDGDKAKAEEFVARPIAHLGTPLFNKIWALTWGNSEAPVVSK